MKARNVLLMLVLCALPACQQGYKSADDLRADERGPEHCAQSCHELGMRMSAFVLVEHGTSGCVCAPTTTGQGGELTGSTAGVAASHVVLEEARRQAEAQRQATTAPGAP